jgi:hypothetical protein
LASEFVVQTPIRNTTVTTNANDPKKIPFFILPLLFRAYKMILSPLP